MRRFAIKLVFGIRLNMQILTVHLRVLFDVRVYLEPLKEGRKEGSGLLSFLPVSFSGPFLLLLSLHLR